MADALKGWLNFMLTDGQAFAKTVGYAPLPRDLAQKALAQLDQITRLDAVGPPPSALADLQTMRPRQRPDRQAVGARPRTAGSASLALVAGSASW